VTRDIPYHRPRRSHWEYVAVVYCLYFCRPLQKNNSSKPENRRMTDKSVDALPVAITTSYVYSVAVFFGLEGMDFFWDLATLIDIMLVGYWLEMKSRMAASRALESLVALLPAVVDVERDNQVTDIALKDLRSGDILLIKPGEKTPADGMILEGSSYMNESMLTGKSVPV